MYVPIIGIFLPVWAIVVIIAVILLVLWKTDIIQTLVFLIALILLLKILGIVDIF